MLQLVIKCVPNTNRFCHIVSFFWPMLKKIRFWNSSSSVNYLLNGHGDSGSLHAILLIWDIQLILPANQCE